MMEQLSLFALEPAGDNVPIPSIDRSLYLEEVDLVWNDSLELDAHLSTLKRDLRDLQAMPCASMRPWQISQASHIKEAMKAIRARIRELEGFPDH